MQKLTHFCQSVPVVRIKPLHILLQLQQTELPDYTLQLLRGFTVLVYLSVVLIS